MRSKTSVWGWRPIAARMTACALTKVSKPHRSVKSDQPILSATRSYLLPPSVTMKTGRMNPREFLKRAGMALIAVAGLPGLVKSLPTYAISSQDLVLASLPAQLLLDLFGLGSGQINKIGARLMSKLPPEQVLRTRREAVAHARHGDHWLGPWALHELLTIATNPQEEHEVRKNALGALARGLRMSPSELLGIPFWGHGRPRVLAPRLGSS
jgi:hypothetical protein